MKKGGWLMIVVIAVVIILFFKGCIDSERQERDIQRKKIEWDLKIEENRRKYGK